MENIVPGNITIELPVKVNYSVLEDLIRERALGEKLGTINEDGETTNYAEILDITFGESIKEEFDFSVNIKFKTLTKVFKNKLGRMEMHLALDFNKATQEVSIRDYELEGDTQSWLMNNFIEKTVNTLLYGKLKRKMNFDLRPVIKEQLQKLNEKAVAGLTPKQGILLKGEIDHFAVESIVPCSGFLLVRLMLHANARLAINNLDLDKF